MVRVTKMTIIRNHPNSMRHSSKSVGHPDVMPTNSYLAVARDSSTPPTASCQKQLHDVSPKRRLVATQRGLETVEPENAGLEERAFRLPRIQSQWLDLRSQLIFRKLAPVICTPQMAFPVSGSKTRTRSNRETALEPLPRKAKGMSQKVTPQTILRRYST